MNVLSVNIGTAEPIQAKSGRSGIFKRPASGPVRVGTLGLVGDHIVDTESHGGPEQAIYVFTQPDYDHWSERLGQTLATGTFGENLLISDLESASLAIGERLRIGSVLLEITSARIPCVTLAVRMNDPEFVKTFRQVRRPGFYARVLEEGEVAAGQPFQLEGRLPVGGASVLDSFEYFYAKTPPSALLQRLLDAPIHEKLRSELTEKFGTA
ncbi:MOSC domain-containing protein [Deinococcus sp.]|uniref:MOSC domain-containing protein n=1 Tax=Deinococcus sp. TaxID=47478 RepID=UPI003C7ADB3F